MSQDPYVTAGRSWCEKCQVWGLPTDAAWLAEDVLVATYGGCSHVAITRVVDTAEILPEARCTALTKLGRRCRHDAVHGGLCSVHSGSRREASR